jgi:ribosomal protein S18 acetylase RimI-like enzyme
MEGIPMIETINETQHPENPEKFKQAVRAIFPILCFTPEQTEAFIEEFEPKFDGRSSVIQDDKGRLTFCRFYFESPQARYIQYLIPSVWEDRYLLIQDAIEKIRDKFLTDNSEHELRMRINEKPPSHTSYFAGLLPGTGFRLIPRVSMIADQDLVQQLTLPGLPPDIHETPFQEEQLINAIDIFFQAHEVNRQALSEKELMLLRAGDTSYITGIYPLKSTRQTWIGLEHLGQLIGFAFGGVWNQEISLEEVALLPAYHGKGLGRYLSIRCLQAMNSLYDGSNKYFSIGTDRTYIRALKLYHRLGFTIGNIESYASLVNHQFSETKT